jgi:enoyl-CoA hydratase/carnithine racemase
MADNILTLDGLIFEATKINFHNNILTITLSRPKKKNAK